MSVLGQMRFLFGWPLWFLFGLALAVTALIRWRVQRCRQDLDLALVASLMALHGLVSWLALLTIDETGRPELLYSQVYAVETVFSGMTLAGLVGATLWRLWRRDDAAD